MNSKSMMMQKPLVIAIRTLLSGGFVFGLTSIQVKAGELPVPSNAVTLSTKPVEIATQGNASASVAGNTLTIQQRTDKAVLNWQTFNIGPENSVKFEQPSSSSLALNNIHQANASQIMGKLTANGQVYLVNQNGFVFGKDAQVNVNSLVATTLGISKEVFQQGITKVFDLDGSAALQGSGEIVLKDGNGNALKDTSGNPIKIQIILANGASIQTNDKGGRVIIAAPSITNEGDIATPEGQTILAAAKDKVYLQESSDPSTRGLLVEVGKGGDVNNVGNVLAKQGNVSLLGFAVNQKGIVSATTSVKLNGSVRLLAREGIQDRLSTGGKLLPQSTVRAVDENDGLGKSASVNLTQNSWTSVALSDDKTETAIDAQTQTPSSIEVSGHDVVLSNDATLEANSGNVTINAVDNLSDTAQKGSAQIKLETGSKIDVSGIKAVNLPVQRNVVNVELRKNELRDAPLQRDGVMYGKTVAVDLRNASLIYDNTGKLSSASIPTADIKGAVDRIAKNIDERSTSGGKISLKSSGVVISQENSTLDFSGGSIQYHAGDIESTSLTANGQVFAIEKADPNLTYDGLLTRKYTDAGFVEGKSGGTLDIQTYESVLDGALQGQTVSGIYQRSLASQAQGSLLNLDLSHNNTFGKQSIVFGKIPFDSLSKGEKETTVDLRLSANTLQTSGISTVDIKTNGSVTIAKDVSLDFSPLLKGGQGGFSLKIAAQNVEVQGSIIAPSGHIDFQPIKIDGKWLPSSITLGESAVIDVSGRWINDLHPLLEGGGGEVAIDGGTVSLQTEQADLHLATSSHIDVSGGAWLSADNKTTAGKAGSIHLLASSHDAGAKSASLIMQGKLAGWGMKQGGDLNLSSNEVRIGNSLQFPLANLPPLEGGTGKTPLTLSPEFFMQNGFANYTLTSYLHGVSIDDNIKIQLQQQNVQLSSDAASKATGSHLSEIGSIVTLPDALRNPVNLTLSLSQPLTQNRAEVLTLGKNALIQGDTQAAVNLNSDTSIFVNGAIDVPAGNIRLTINPPTGADSGFFNTQGIWLSSESRLSAKGVLKPTLNALNLTTGEVLSGGNVSLSAKRGTIVTRAKSMIDVSGTSELLDFVQTDHGSTQLSQQIISSTGGTIGLIAGEGTIADGRFQAKGGSGAAGGVLNVELNSGLRAKPDFPVSSGFFPDDEQPNLARLIEIAKSATPVLDNTVKQGDALNPEMYSGKALLSEPLINQAGFASLSFKTDVLGANGEYAGGVLFKGDVTLTAAKQIVLDTPQFQVTNGASKVILNSAYVALGSRQSRLDTALGDGNVTTTLAPQAVNGLGQITVNGKNIDLIGGLSFQNIGQVNLNSESDLRATGIRTRPESKDYLGEFKLDGNLNVSAAQIYPTTLSSYTFSVTGDTTISPSLLLKGDFQTTPIYSAAGSLTFNSQNITQSGTVKAPFGLLSLNATKQLHLSNGSVTSVSGEGVTVPFGRGLGGLNWLYPFDSNASVASLISTPPEKRLSLSGRDVLLDKGATINLSGGGDLYAYEFVPGAGGSQDVLNTTLPANAHKFAVLPDLQHAITPYDPLESSEANINMGDSVYLRSGAGLAAGWYTVLPAHYALLPNAYLVTPVAGTQDWLPNQTAKDVAGTTLVAGRFGDVNAGIQNPRWQGFAVQSGKIARAYSEYTDYFANDFFAAKASEVIAQTAQFPKDAGSLVLNAQANLGLNANFFMMPVADGHGGLVDISADHLAIVSRREDANANKDAETVSLFVEDLNQLGAASLLLGGIRSQNKNGQQLSVNTQTLTIAKDTKLKGSDILLAATDTLKISTGATVQSTGKSKLTNAKLQLTSNQPVIDVDGNPVVDDSGKAVMSADGAFVRVSSFPLESLQRDDVNASGSSGILKVEKGAALQSDNSMLLDASKDTIFAGDIVMNGGSLGLNASRISLGNAPANTSGLVLKSTDFKVDDLQLRSRSDLDLYGAVRLDAKQLLIDAASIRGLNNAAQTVTINADNLTLSNHSAAVLSLSGAEHIPNTGEISLNAQNIQLGSGEYAFNGFNLVKLNAAETISGMGQTLESTTGNSRLSDAGVLRVVGDLSASAKNFTSGSGATTQIDASGYQATFISTKATPFQPLFEGENFSDGLGGSWSITADNITTSAHFDLASGNLKLTAQKGDILLSEGSAIDVSGRDIAFASGQKVSPAGNVQLSAAGNITLAKNATIEGVGALDIHVPIGQFAWNGTLQTTQGSLQLFADKLGDFSVLNSKIAHSGFSDKVALTQNSGDVTLAATDNIKAKEFFLMANQGKVSLHGGIEAKTVEISGNNGITLTGNISATGGNVTLDTVHQNDAGSGLLDLSGKGVIEAVNVHLRTGRDDEAKTLNMSAINTPIKADVVNLEATRVYENQSDINSETIVQIQNDTANFMAAAPTLKNNSGAKLTLMPGVEFRSEGDLTLSTAWNFASKTYSEETGENRPNWRYGDGQGNQAVAGFLTLNATKDVLINASLTDAFATAALPGTDETSTFQDVLQAGETWHYRLKAGHDVQLHSLYFPVDEYGQSAYDPVQVVLRTGSGNIDISAGRDISLIKGVAKTTTTSNSDNVPADEFASEDNGATNYSDSNLAAAIYTAGKPAQFTKAQLLNGEIAGVPARKTGESDADYLNRLDAVQMNTRLRYGYFDENLLGLQFRVGEYPTQGGSIHLNAGGNITGINTGQEISDWLVRSGVIDENNRPTAWGINLSGDKSGDDRGVHFFNQNIGALGGGDVSINAGGNVQDLSVMLPTTGKPFGTLSTTAVNQWVQNGTVVNGGGNLNINAGGNIVGGEYFVGKGTGKLNAAGSVQGLGEGNLGALIELGEATFSITARHHIEIGSVFNPTVLKQNVLLPNRIGDSRFFTYGSNSGVSLFALAGNVALQNNVAAIKSAKGQDGSAETGFEYAVYPPSLSAVALLGDLTINQSLTLFADAQGKLELLAGNNIGVDKNAGQVITVNMSDADVNFLPSVLKPTQQLEGSLNDGLIRTRERLDASTPNPTLIHANLPVHLNSTTHPIVQAKFGSIAFPSTSEVTFYLPQTAQFLAGNDINNLSLSSQQLNEDDITRIVAGRDINFDATVDDNGVVQSNDKQIEVGGVGEVQIQAGRNINLGASSGINTLGNTKNSVLPSKGASISLSAGTAQAVDKKRLSSLYATIKEVAATAAAAPDAERKALYQKGYNAINSTFSTSSPSSDVGQGRGDLSLVFSQIKTLSGGDINIAVPNGAVNVGLAGMVGGIKKMAVQLGIVAQQSGEVNAITQGNFNVNQSRVFTMGGGDITIWSSKGDIDAGKGAKSSISAPAPITKIDSLGNVVTIFPPVVSGSGIQTITPQIENARQGNVYLAAPSGIVDAGEAGISGGKVVIAANAVVGASNISATGGSVGVPTAVPASSVPSGANGAAASATKSATQMNDGSQNQQTSEDKNGVGKKKAVMSFLSTDLIGFGNCSAADVRDKKDGCGG